MGEMPYTYSILFWKLCSNICFDVDNIVGMFLLSLIKSWNISTWFGYEFC